MTRPLSAAERLHLTSAVRARTASSLLRAQADVARLQRSWADALAGSDLDRMVSWAVLVLSAQVRLGTFQATCEQRPLAPALCAGGVAHGVQAWSLYVPLAARAGRELWLPTGHEPQLPWLWALAELSGMEPEATWLAGLLHAWFRSGVMDSVPADPALNDLMWCLVKARHTGVWPDETEWPETLGRYRPLMALEGTDPGAAVDAVHAVGDLALRCRAEVLEVQPDLAYETEPWGLLPLDLLLLSHQRVARRGAPLPGLRDHPWTASPMAQMPVGRPAPAEPADAQMAQLAAVARQQLGDAWQQFPALPAVPD
ncbi:hypothetical protein [Roseateles sp. BYS87W]|uniref:Uncharacterized protein n=1 Tax=Pelomonas baiyunensis TaxID=3299026 RepID=A0ABW7H0X8_9BURK